MSAPATHPLRGTATPPSTAAPHKGTGRWSTVRNSRWWPWAITLVSGAFVLLIGTLLFRQARSVDWGAVWNALIDLPMAALLGGAALAFASHGIYSSFDLFGRHYTRHGLPVARTIGTTLIAYPFTLNLGSLIGGVTVRYRLYSRQGLSVGDIGQVVAISIITNWLGYFVLAGAVFWLWTPQLPEGWDMAGHQLRWIGSAMAAVSGLYLVACVLRRGAPITLRGHAFPVPHGSVGLLQVVLSAVNWMVMAGAIWLLTQQQVPYVAALATVLLGAVAGLISRIPAGLGVLEAVGTAVLSAYMPAPQALAAILAYRTLYFFAPLAVAALAFGVVELRWRKGGTSTPAPASATSSN